MERVNLSAYFSTRIGESSNGRTPGSGPGNWGSNPCSPARLHPWLNWIERCATDAEVGGSSPPGCTQARSSSG